MIYNNYCLKFQRGKEVFVYVKENERQTLKCKKSELLRNTQPKIMESSDKTHITMLGRQSGADTVPDLGDLLISGSAI